MSLPEKLANHAVRKQMQVAPDEITWFIRKWAGCCILTAATWIHFFGFVEKFALPANGDDGGIINSRF
jgi:hypothetical protein